MSRGFDRLEVSPAHAGMVPEAAVPAMTATRLPRPRGDGPKQAQAVKTQAQSPPPTRGQKFQPARVTPRRASLFPDPRSSSHVIAFCE